MSSPSESKPPAPSSPEAPAAAEVGSAEAGPTDAGPTEPGRRHLIVATAVGVCALGAAAAGPAIALVLAPLQAKKAGGRWVRTVRLDQLQQNVPRRVAIIDERRDAWTIEEHVELGSVWLVREGEAVRAFSSVCPHLGCSVNAVTTPDGKPGGGFMCPCHTSAFDVAGKRSSGPSPRDLDRLETRVVDGHVDVDFRRFRIGIEQKVET